MRGSDKNSAGRAVRYSRVEMRGRVWVIVRERGARESEREGARERGEVRS